MTPAEIWMLEEDVAMFLLDAAKANNDLTEEAAARAGTPDTGGKGGTGRIKSMDGLKNFLKSQGRK